MARLDEAEPALDPGQCTEDTVDAIDGQAVDSANTPFDEPLAEIVACRLSRCLWVAPRVELFSERGPVFRAGPAYRRV